MKKKGVDFKQGKLLGDGVFTDHYVFDLFGFMSCIGTTQQLLNTEKDKILAFAGVNQEGKSPPGIKDYQGQYSLTLEFAMKI